MKIENINEKIIRKLRQSKITEKMISLEYCDFLVYVEHNDKILGAAGVGGIFHVPSLQIDPEYFNKGLGVKLFLEVIKESKKRKYSFLSGSRNPENVSAVRIHDFFKLMPIFQVNYRPDFVRDIVFLGFNKKGKIMKKILKIFNNKLGMIFLITSIKLFRGILFKFLLTLSPEEFPSPNVQYALKNFKKI